MARFSRKGFYVLFLTFALFPVVLLGLSTYFYSAHENEAVFLCLLGGMSFVASVWLFRIYERKMRSSVASLVKARCDEIHATNGGKNLQEEIARLHACIEEQRCGYEREIEVLEERAISGQRATEELSIEMDRKLEEVRLAYLEYEDMRKEYERLQEEFAYFQKESTAIAEQKDALLGEYQQTISEQRMIIEKKQRYIAKLEGKVHDLMHEIRSLLQLEESAPPSSPPPRVDIADPPYGVGRRATYDYAVSLGQYIELAERFTGVDHLGYVGGKSPRFLDTTMDTYTIDQRRLFDTFRDESGCVLFVFSQAKDQFLFVNPFVKRALGWSPEKFMKDFPELIVSGYPEWLALQKSLYERSEVHTSLVLRAKTGDELPFQCHMGLISKGPFLNHAIGLLAPSG